MTARFWQRTVSVRNCDFGNFIGRGEGIGSFPAMSLDFRVK
jgi:hypothetical protein